MFGSAYGGLNAKPPASIGNIFLSVPCTLKEFYEGSIKTVTYQRQEIELDGKTLAIKTVKKQIIIKKGASPVNNQTFRGEGNQMPGRPASDLIVSLIEFIPKGDPNEELLNRYKRTNTHDLVYTHTISLKDAINARPARLRTLDGRVLIVSVDEIINPKTVRVVPGEGMPVMDPNNRDDHIATARGNLFVKFDIIFPANLTEE